MSKNKILFVEDELSLGLIVKESLEIRGFEVNYCQDGRAGLNSYKEFKPEKFFQHHSPSLIAKARGNDHGRGLGVYLTGQIIDYRQVHDIHTGFNSFE